MAIFMRILGAWLLLGAVIALTIDLTGPADAPTTMTALGEHWFKIHPASLNASQAGVQRYVHPVLWDPVIVSLLKTPTWIVLAVLGSLFYWIGRRRPRFEVFSN